MSSNKKKCCPSAEEIREIQHLEKVFGSKLQNYGHTGYQRAELPYTARDATTKKKKQ